MNFGKKTLFGKWHGRHITAFGYKMSKQTYNLQVYFFLKINFGNLVENVAYYLK